MRPALLLLPLLLAACVAPAPGTEAPTVDPLPENACGASDLQDLVGQNRAVLATMKFAGPVRIIGPDMAVTADFSPTRLNISYDRRDIITAVACY